MKFNPRCELTFALNDQSTDALLRSASQKLAVLPDATLIQDRYFDANGVVQHHSKAAWRQYRVRRFGGRRDAFLECKQWKKEISFLRQTSVPDHELARLTSPIADKSWDGKWFQKKVVKHKLKPSIETRLERTVLESMSLEGPMRLTIDRGIQCQSSANGRVYSPPERLMCNVVKMKYQISLPTSFKALIYEFMLLPERPSLLMTLSQDQLDTCSSSPDLLPLPTTCALSQGHFTPSSEVEICQLG